LCEECENKHEELRCDCGFKGCIFERFCSVCEKDISLEDVDEETETGGEAKDEAEPAKLGTETGGIKAADKVKMTSDEDAK